MIACPFTSIFQTKSNQRMCSKYGRVLLHCKLSKVIVYSLISREEIKFSGLLHISELLIFCKHLNDSISLMFDM
jgi:hypothetical protein